MNERIRELIEQATLPPHRSQGYGGEPTHIYPGTLDPAKFAELIVKECADVIQKEVSFKYVNGGEEEEFMNGHYAASLLARVVIKNHFGVRVE